MKLLQPGDPGFINGPGKRFLLNPNAQLKVWATCTRLEKVGTVKCIGYGALTDVHSRMYIVDGNEHEQWFLAYESDGHRTEYFSVEESVARREEAMLEREKAAFEAGEAYAIARVGGDIHIVKVHSSEACPEYRP